MKTVAYVNERALGVAALVPLACRDIVFKKGARMGDIRQTVSGRNGVLHDLSDTAAAGLAEEGRRLGQGKGHPEAVAVAMIDPDAEIVEASDSQTGRQPADPACRGRSRARPVPDRPDPQSRRGLFSPWAPTMPPSFGLGHVVNGSDELKDLYGLSPDDASRGRRLGRLAGDRADQSLRELDAALHRRRHARGRARSCPASACRRSSRRSRFCSSSAATT